MYLINKIDKEIQVLSAYNSNKLTKDLIYSCRLWPLHKGNRISTYGFKFYDNWIDEYNNIVVFNKQNIKIKYNTLNKKQFTTDFYCLLSAEKILKISKGVAWFISEDNYILCSLGIDNCFRCFINENNIFQNISPLFIGINNIFNILKNQNADNLELNQDPIWPYEIKKKFYQKI